MKHHVPTRSDETEVIIPETVLKSVYPANPLWENRNRRTNTHSKASLATYPVYSKLWLFRIFVTVLCLSCPSCSIVFLLKAMRLEKAGWTAWTERAMNSAALVDVRVESAMQETQNITFVRWETWQIPSRIDAWDELSMYTKWLYNFRCSCPWNIANHNKTMFEKFGGPVTLYYNWANQVLWRMGFSKRRPNSQAKVLLIDFDCIKKQFLMNIEMVVSLEEISVQLVLKLESNSSEICCIF